MEILSEFNTQNFMEETNFEYFVDPIANFGLKYDYDQIIGPYPAENLVEDLNFRPNHNAFNTQNFTEVANFEYLIDPIADFCLNYDYDQNNPLSDWNSSSNLNALPLVYENRGKGGEENDIGEESSAATTTNMIMPTQRKGDRSRTLISERRRRGKMKEKLYALRTLVPNITKMDKASIVGDAVLYVQDLQMKAKNLRADIAGLESSLAEGHKYQNDIKETQRNHHFLYRNQLVCKKILQMTMFQVEERELYVKMEVQRGQGVVALLYKALESLSRFSLQSSNLGTIEKKFILTFTLKVPESEANINLENLKLSITRAFLNQGLDFQTQQSG